MLPILGDTCHLCGKPVNKRLPGNHAKGPSIDHIRPRAKGGSIYDPDNCALAHMGCNAGKRDRQPTSPKSRTW